MPPTSAEISSLVTLARDLMDRVSKAGESLDRGDTEQAALALFEAERALRTAVRSMDRAVRALA